MGDFTLVVGMLLSAMHTNSGGVFSMCSRMGISLESLVKSFLKWNQTILVGKTQKGYGNSLSQGATAVVSI